MQKELHGKQQKKMNMQCPLEIIIHVAYFWNLIWRTTVWVRKFHSFWLFYYIINLFYNRVEMDYLTVSATTPKLPSMISTARNGACTNGCVHSTFHCKVGRSQNFHPKKHSLAQFTGVSHLRNTVLRLYFFHKGGK